MSTYVPVILSGSTNGLGIKVAATATAGTTVHTAHATSTDKIWLWATNSSTAPVKVIVEFGGVASPDNTIEVTIEPEDGLYKIVDGLPLTNSKVVGVFAASANVIMIYGEVMRYTA